MKDFEFYLEEQENNSYSRNWEYEKKRILRKEKKYKHELILDIIIAVVFIADVILTIDSLEKLFEKEEPIQKTEICVVDSDKNYDIPATEYAYYDGPTTYENEYDNSATFKVTHYCGCSKCCGSFSDGSESIAYGCKGDKLTPYKSIAVDNEIIPYGTVVYDNEGNEYIAQDVGGAINGYHIDLFVGNHKEALNEGIQYKELYW